MKAYTLGLYEKAMPNELPLTQKLQLARAAGYDCLEISIDETDEKLARLNWSAAQRQELQQAIYTHRLPLATMCLSAHRKYPLGSENPQTVQAGLLIMEKAIVLAEELGIRLIQLAGYDEYYGESNAATRQIFFENLHRAVKMAAAHKVMLGFETMETPFMNTCEKAMWYVRQVASPYLTVYPDIGNMTNAALSTKNTVLQDLQTAQGHLSAMHLKETAPGVFREMRYGTGHVDFQAAITAALALGVQAYTAEFWYTGNSDWQEALLQSNRFLRSFFENAKAL